MLFFVKPQHESAMGIHISSLFWTPLPSLPILTLSVDTEPLFIFYILSYLLLKTMGWLSGFLVSSVSVQKLFCGIFSVFKCSFDEFVGDKMVSQSYSSTILRPPLTSSSLNLEPHSMNSFSHMLSTHPCLY